MNLGFEIIRPVESHAKLLFEWRNDPYTLEMSFHSKPKVWIQFWEEFSVEYFSLASLPPLFVLYQGQRCAVLRFKLAENHTFCERKSCEISINVSPDYRRKGIGALALSEICDWVKQQGYDDVYAYIKKNNKPSLKAFTSAGYEDLGDFEKNACDINEIFTVRCFIKRLTPTLAFDKKVFVIAEAGSNWHVGTPKQDVAMAHALIDAAVDAGADAVKFQVFRPESVYVKNAGISGYLSKEGNVEDISVIFENLSMPYTMIDELSAYCCNCGIEFMASTFSEKDFLIVDPYVKYHKIASYEINHIRLIELAAKSNKPLILSTGASTEEEIRWAVNTFYQNGGKDITLLQCTAKYPAEVESMNLRTIPMLRHHFQVRVGLSDHSRDPMTAPIAAVALGARVIEKHFTLSNTLPGPDHFFALLPCELKKMIEEIRTTEKIMGSGIKLVLSEEMELRSFAKRGLQAIREVKKGDILSEGVTVGILRPGNQRRGVHPKFMSEIEGRKALRDIPLGDGILNGDWE